MITHRLEEAKFLADKILMIEAGHIVEYTDCETFFTHPQTREQLSSLKRRLCKIPAALQDLSSLAGLLFLAVFRQGGRLAEERHQMS